MSASPSQQISRQSPAIVPADLVPGRDFHYAVDGVYRRPREVTSTSYHHRSGGSGGSDNYSDYAYLEHKASPYHTGKLNYPPTYFD